MDEGRRKTIEKSLLPNLCEETWGVCPVSKGHAEGRSDKKNAYRKASFASRRKGELRLWGKGTEKEVAEQGESRPAIADGARGPKNEQHVAGRKKGL